MLLSEDLAASLTAQWLCHLPVGLFGKSIYRDRGRMTAHSYYKIHYFMKQTVYTLAGNIIRGLVLAHIAMAADYTQMGTPVLML